MPHGFNPDKTRNPNPRVIFFPKTREGKTEEEINEEVKLGFEEIVNNEDYTILYVGMGLNEDGLAISAEIYYCENDKIHWSFEERE